MPVVSKAQWGLMQKAKHDPAFAKEKGILQSVAEDFIDATPKGTVAKLPRHVPTASRRTRQR